jgi:hypothetical protein
MSWVVDYRVEVADPPLGSAPADARHPALARGESQTNSWPRFYLARSR